MSRDSVWDTDPPITPQSVRSFGEAIGRELERLAMDDGTEQMRSAALRHGLRTALGIDDTVTVTDEGLIADVTEYIRHARAAASAAEVSGEPQASVVSAERVVDLERKLAELERELADAIADRDGALHAVEDRMRERDAAQHNAESFREQAESASKALDETLARVEELERSGSMAAAADADQEISELRALLDGAYVAREVPWTDVAAGMMTLSREEHPRPWMVDGWTEDDTIVVLRNGEQTFPKRPTPGETVKVLVPYVAPGAAEREIAEQLGGTQVES